MSHPGSTEDDARSHRPVRGIAFMLIGTVLITINDALMKLVIVDYPLGEAIFVRGIFALIPIALLLRRSGGMAAGRWHSLRGQLLSAGSLVCSLYLFVYCLSILPLGLLTIMLYVNPLVVAALAPWWLNEKVGFSRWAGVAIGFAGTVLVLQPTSPDFDWRLLFALLVACVVGYRDLLLRKLVAKETSVSLLWFSSTAVTLTALPTIALGWIPMPLIDIAILAVAGLSFGFGIYFITDSFRYADASLVAPFKYSGVVWALVLGYLLWGESVNGVVIAGAIVIVGSGLFLART